MSSQDQRSLPATRETLVSPRQRIPPLSAPLPSALEPTASTWRLAPDDALSLPRPAEEPGSTHVSFETGTTAAARRRPLPLRLAVPQRGHYLDAPSLSRSASAETIKGPSTASAMRPLTPFPPWGSYSEHEDEASMLRFNDPSRDRDGIQDVEAWWRAQTQPVVRGVVHGVILTMQSVSTAAVLSVLVALTIAKKGEATDEFWAVLWRRVPPGLLILLVMTLTALVLHEAWHLSALSMVFVQTAALLLSTLATAAVAVLALEMETAETVKGILLGSCVFMEVVSLLAFVRAVILWWWLVHASRTRRLGRDRREEQRYGTFRYHASSDEA